ncbi:hypothetical protein M9H77_12641 [Catharanthus roseus]|uniref:Uncharacterized protein n=1 Tax=Catharanthus roseus TaxID=4058 RepID=A0ACC0BHZ8_CATRO|nr:hypothetical protein M9H77_12641 [Catharanthus roseus]
MITHIGRRIMLAMWRSGNVGWHIRDGPVLPVADLSSPGDDFIRWYRDITWMMEVDDMATGVIQGPPSTLTQIASFAKKVQTSIYFPVQPSRCRPREPVPDRGARGVNRGVCRLPGGGARGGCAPNPRHPGGRGHADPGRGGERSEGSGGC